MIAGDLVFLPQGTTVILKGEVVGLKKPEFGILLKLNERVGWNKIWFFGAIPGAHEAHGKIYKYNGEKI